MPLDLRTNKPEQATSDDDFTEELKAIEKEPWFKEIDTALEDHEKFVEKEYLHGQPGGAFIIWKTTDTNGTIKLCLSLATNQYSNRYKHFEIKKGKNSEYYLSTEMEVFMRSRSNSVKYLINYCIKKKIVKINTTPVPPQDPPQDLIEELYDNITREKAIEILNNKKHLANYEKSPYLIRKTSKLGGQYAISLLNKNKNNEPESHIFVYFSNKYYIKGNEKGTLEEVKNSLNSEFEITLKPIKRLVVWDFDKTFMKGHWYGRSTRIWPQGAKIEDININIDDIYKGTKEILQKEVKGSTSYVYMEPLLKTLSKKKDIVLAIASNGRRELILKVLEEEGLLEYFTHQNILTPKNVGFYDGYNTDKSEMIKMLKKNNNIKDNSDIYFFDDDGNNIKKAYDTFTGIIVTHTPEGFKQENVVQLMKDLGLSFQP